MEAFFAEDRFDQIWESHPDLRLTDSADTPHVLGFPVAVAYDPPPGCAELRFPTSLEDLLREPGAQAAHARAAAKWERLAADLRVRGVLLGEPRLYLAEIERA